MNKILKTIGALSALAVVGTGTAFAIPQSREMLANKIAENISPKYQEQISQNETLAKENETQQSKISELQTKLNASESFKITDVELLKSLRYFTTKTAGGYIITGNSYHISRLLSIKDNLSYMEIYEQTNMIKYSFKYNGTTVDGGMSVADDSSIAYKVQNGAYGNSVGTVTFVDTAGNTIDITSAEYENSNFICKDIQLVNTIFDDTNKQYIVSTDIKIVLEKV